MTRRADQVRDRGWLALYWCRDARGPALRGLRGAAGWFGCLVGLLVAVTVAAPVVSDYRSFVITGDSMSGEFDRGALAYEQEVPVSDLEAGDVITYTPPAGEGPGGLVTHRITSIKTDPERGRVYQTKGDANQDPDPWDFTLAGPTQARVAFHVPLVGYAIAALSIRPVRIAVIGLPALFLALTLIGRVWREAGEEARAAQAAAATPVAQSR